MEKGCKKDESKVEEGRIKDGQRMIKGAYKMEKGEIKDG